MIVPGADGMFGVLPGHVPTISELKPGVVEVTTAPGEVQKYFVSSGFVFAHADSTLDICGIEVRSEGTLRVMYYLSSSATRSTEECECDVMCPVNRL